MNLFFAIIAFFTVYLEFNNIPNPNLKERIVNELSNQINIIEIKNINQLYSEILQNNLLNNDLFESSYLNINKNGENIEINYYPDITDSTNKLNSKIITEKISEFKDVSILKNNSIKITQEVLKLLNKQYIPFDNEWIYDKIGFKKENDKLFLTIISSRKKSYFGNLLFADSDSKALNSIGIFIESLNKYLYNQETDTEKEFKIKYRLSFFNYKIYTSKSTNISYSKYEMNESQIINIFNSKKDFTKEQLDKFKNLTNKDLEKINENALYLINIFGERL